jgi:hypothetical protein
MTALFSRTPRPQLASDALHHKRQWRRRRSFFLHPKLGHDLILGGKCTHVVCFVLFIAHARAQMKSQQNSTRHRAESRVDYTAREWRVHGQSFELPRESVVTSFLPKRPPSDVNHWWQLSRRRVMSLLNKRTEILKTRRPPARVCLSFLNATFDHFSTRNPPPTHAPRPRLVIHHSDECKSARNKLQNPTKA